MRGMDEDRFLLLRGAVALAMVDGRYTDEEDAMIRAQAKTGGISVAQSRILDQDRAARVDPMSIYQQLVNVRLKGMFVTIARGIFNADGDFSPEEQRVMDALSQVHEKTLDEALPGLRRELDAQKTRGQKPVVMNARMDGAPKDGTFAAIVRWITG
ncbi:MAG: hypothetical protein VX589_19635 [Myxococcota bacterium]|nr:hypothetical protein [Myxococcota bacterium]